jgi:four helix bundle protein
MTGDELEDRLIRFAVRVGRLVEALPSGRLSNHVAGQLIRSATSVPANYAEGCVAESRADFIHKLSIALKELRESRVWLRIIAEADLVPPPRLRNLRQESDEIGAILAQSLITARRRSAGRL